MGEWEGDKVPGIPAPLRPEWLGGRLAGELEGSFGRPGLSLRSGALVWRLCSRSHSSSSPRSLGASAQYRRVPSPAGMQGSPARGTTRRPRRGSTEPERHGGPSLLSASLSPSRTILSGPPPALQMGGSPQLLAFPSAQWRCLCWDSGQKMEVGTRGSGCQPVLPPSSPAFPGAEPEALPLPGCVCVSLCLSVYLSLVRAGGSCHMFLLLCWVIRVTF